MKDSCLREMSVGDIYFAGDRGRTTLAARRGP